MEICQEKEKIKLSLLFGLKIFLKNEKKRLNLKPFSLNCDCNTCLLFENFLKDDTQKNLNIVNEYNHFFSKLIESQGLRKLVIITSSNNNGIYLI
jgi:hypothetical protein